MIELNKERFEELAEVHDPHCVSIFIPTHRAGQEVNQGHDQKMLKNQLKEAKKRLQDYAMNEKEIDEYLNPAYKLLDDIKFWKYQSDGLVVFIAKDFFKYYTVPVTFEAFTYVSDHFYLKPIVPLLDQDSKYYLLALSLHDVKLFEGTPYEIAELDVDDLLPERLEDAVGYDYKQKHLEFREGHAGNEKTMFHGHGAGKDDKKDEILKFFRAVNKGAMSLLHDKSAPLLIAAVDYLIPIYKEANEYKYLFNTHIMGNPEFEDPILLHEKAMNILEDHFNKKEKEKKAMFEQALSNKKGSYDEREIIPAAINGRIDTLFVKNKESLWGIFDKKSNTIQTDERQTTHNSDLLNIAAIQTILHNGNVYLTPAEEMPEKTSSVNAILRF